MSKSTLVPSIIIKKVRFRPGYLYGACSPLLIVQVDFQRTPVNVETAIELMTKITLEYGHAHRVKAPTSDQSKNLPQFLATALAFMLSAARMPRYGDTQVLSMGRNDGVDSIIYKIPVTEKDFRVIFMLFEWLVTLLIQSELPGISKIVVSRGGEIFQNIKRQAPPGVNMCFIIPAANEMKIPWSLLVPGVYQFGWGCNSRLMKSTVTDLTPAISAGIARSKPTTSMLLKVAGIPVAEHKVITTEENAVKAANLLGFPVAVKPIERDQGEGVSAGLDSESALRKAFRYAQKYGEQVMVEQHIPGEDYRFQVSHGEVIWAVHRIPPVLTGNGMDDVTTLLRTYNEERGKIPEASLEPVRLDDEAIGLLEEQSFTPQSVPENDRRVRIRRIANVTTGAIPVPILDEVHPDNLALVKRAVHALRLDLAGVDFIMPDIRRSWHEVGGAICEINAQPQFWPTLHPQVLSAMIKGDGRIPVIFVLGDLESNDELRKVIAMLEAQIDGLGVASDEELRLNGVLVSKLKLSIYRRTLALVINKETRAILICTKDREIVNLGLAVDRVDALFICTGAVSNSVMDTGFLGLIETLARLCKGSIFITADTPPFRLSSEFENLTLLGTDQFYETLGAVFNRKMNEQID